MHTPRTWDDELNALTISKTITPFYLRYPEVFQPGTGPSGSMTPNSSWVIESLGNFEKSLCPCHSRTNYNWISRTEMQASEWFKALSADTSVQLMWKTTFPCFQGWDWPCWTPVAACHCLLQCLQVHCSSFSESKMFYGLRLCEVAMNWKHWVQPEKPWDTQSAA